MVSTGVDGDHFDGVGTKVGRFARLQDAPDELHRIQIVPVCREPLDDEPSALLGDPGLHDR